MDKTDIYIKDEGYADVRLHESLEAKEWCHKNGYTNSLVDFGKEWCGEPVWYPGMIDGGYKFGLKLSQVKEFILKARDAGLTVESEFELDFL